MKLVLTNEYANILLLLNGLAIILYFVARKKNRQRAMKFGNFETLEKVAGKGFLKSSSLVLLIRLAAVTTLILAISSPVLVQEVYSPDADFVIALDTSSSMLADDLEPSRLNAAKEVSTSFGSELPEETKLGVVSFSGSVKVESQLNDDKDNVSSIINRIETGETGGTAIGDAISSSTSTLLNTNKSRSVILVTDGRNNVGSSVNDSLEFAERHNVTIHTIGIGSKKGDEPDFGIVEGENATRAQFPNLNQQQLFTIANRTDGKFRAVGNRTALRSAFVNLERSDRRHEFTEYLVFLTAGLLLLEWILATTNYSTLP